jgi:hypothetical protein
MVLHRLAENYIEKHYYNVEYYRQAYVRDLIEEIGAR